MRTATTIKINQYGVSEMVSGPEIPFDEQYQNFRNSDPKPGEEVLLFVDPKRKKNKTPTTEPQSKPKSEAPKTVHRK